MIKEGIHRDITIYDYHADRDYLSASIIKEATKSLKHMHWYMSNTQERESHFDFGNAFEIALMDLMNGTKEFDSSVYIFDESKRPDQKHGMSAKTNKSWKDELYKSTGYIINKHGDQSIDSIEYMLESCWKDAVIQGLIKNTDYQNSLFWVDKKTGLRLKSRPDVGNKTKKVLVDIKTTTDASPAGFTKDICKYGYDLQALMQIRGAVETGLFDEVNNFYWLAVEKCPPYNAQLYCFPKHEWEFTDLVLDYTLNNIKSAKESNKWVGYGQRASNPYGILDFNRPLWHRSEFL